MIAVSFDLIDNLNHIIFEGTRKQCFGKFYEYIRVTKYIKWYIFNDIIETEELVENFKERWEFLKRFPMYKSIFKEKKIKIVLKQRFIQLDVDKHTWPVILSFFQYLREVGKYKSTYRAYKLFCNHGLNKTQSFIMSRYYTCSSASPNTVYYRKVDDEHTPINMSFMTPAKIKKVFVKRDFNPDSMTERELYYSKYKGFIDRILTGETVVNSSANSIKRGLMMNRRFRDAHDHQDVSPKVAIKAYKKWESNYDYSGL